MSHDYRLLYVGDEFPWGDDGYDEVTCVSDLSDAVERLHQRQRQRDRNGYDRNYDYDCVIADYSTMSISEIDTDTPILALTDAENADEAVEAGADDYVAADVPVHVFENRVQNVVSDSSEDELEKYRTLVETAADGMYLLDEDGYIRTVNDALVELTGYTRDELIGFHVSKFLSL
ncbi:MAG: PAS domain S-box protein, partial [Halobacteria archaeon]|nr:PAS domain S-box protein [Halobacteria archaeon]